MVFANHFHLKYNRLVFYILLILILNQIYSSNQLILYLFLQNVSLWRNKKMLSVRAAKFTYALTDNQCLNIPFMQVLSLTL